MYCRRCGTLLPQGVVICPECGTRQRRQANVVHCANCRGRVPMGLTVCPQCGRDVRPAGPRWGPWLAGLVALVLFGLWGLGKLPVEQAGQEIARVRSKLTSLVQVLGPVTRPMQPLETPQVVGQLDAVPTPTVLEPTAQPTEDEAAATPAAAEAPTTEVTTTAEDTATPTGTPAPQATPTPTPADQPTEVPILTPTPLPPTAAPTATVAAPTKASPDSAKPTTYAIQSGDTLLAIANRFNVTLDALLAANKLSVKSVLRIGQQLVIPGAGAPIPPTETSRPRVTATATPLPPTPAPSLFAPVLLNPGDQASFAGGDALIELSWQPVLGIGTGGQYQVTMRWMEGGAPQEYFWFTTATSATLPSARVPPWLWGRADQPARQYTWFVRAVQLTTDGQGGERAIPLSPASPQHVFYWN